MAVMFLLDSVDGDIFISERFWKDFPHFNLIAEVTVFYLPHLLIYAVLLRFLYRLTHDLCTGARYCDFEAKTVRYIIDSLP